MALMLVLVNDPGGDLILYDCRFILPALGELLAIVAVRHLLVPLPAAQIWSLYLVTA